MLDHKVESYNEIKLSLGSDTGNSNFGEKLQKKLAYLKSEKARLEHKIKNSMMIKLHESAYDIDFDDY